MRRAFVIALCLFVQPAAAQGPIQALPQRLRERVTCCIAASLKIGLPVNMLLAVAEMEGGKPGQWVLNKNGSYDVGPMQFNTKYLASLQQRFGITAHDVEAAGCYPYDLAAWRLRKHLDHDGGDQWTRIANYHSRNREHNTKYRTKLVHKAAKWEAWLKQNFSTYEAGRAATPGPKAQVSPSIHQGRGAVRRRTSRRSRVVETKPQEPMLVSAYGEDKDETAQLASLLDGPVIGRQRASKSIGSAHAGRLEDGVQVPKHHGYIVRDGSRAYGTATAVQWLVQAFDKMGSGTRVRVHDMSTEHGGRLGGHKSHQSGRDVDITYYQRGCNGACALQTVAPQNLDAKREWQLLRHWLRAGQVEWMFVDYSLQGPLYNAAIAMGESQKNLDRWFQYPHGAGHPGGTIRHVPNHADHVHVRFRCTQEDVECKATRTRIVRPEGVKTQPGHPLLELLEDESEDDDVEAMRALLSE